MIAPPNRLLYVGATVMMLAAIAAYVFYTTAIGDKSPDSKVIDNLNSASTQEDLDEIVATVGEREITKRAVIVQLSLQAMSDRPLTSEQLLDVLIDRSALAIMADRSGIEVSEDDIDLYIESGVIAPLRDGTLPTDIERMTRAVYEFSGIDPLKADEDERIRAEIRDQILAGRYVMENGGDLALLAEDARSEVEIEVRSIPELPPVPAS